MAENYKHKTNNWDFWVFYRY